MSATGVQTRSASKGGRAQSLFYRDLSASPAARSAQGRGDLGMPGQAAAAAALWRESAGGVGPPPPPFYTLEDRIERSPDAATMGDGTLRSPESFKYTEGKSPLRTPFTSTSLRSGYGFIYGESTPGYSLSTASPPAPSQHQSLGSPTWWSPLKERSLHDSSTGREEEREGGSPVAGVVKSQSGGLLALGPPRDVIRPEPQRPTGVVDTSPEGSEWVTVFGFGAEETNTVMREFEKCGTIVNHVSGPGGANWVHLQYQNQHDAKKALLKNGLQLNGALIVGVKPLDPMKRQALTENVPRGSSFMVLPPRTPGRGTPTSTVQASQRPYYIQGSDSAPRLTGALASPAKSTISKFVDLVFDKHRCDEEVTPLCDPTVPSPLYCEYSRKFLLPSTEESVSPPPVTHLPHYGSSNLDLDRDCNTLQALQRLRTKVHDLTTLNREVMGPSEAFNPMDDSQYLSLAEDYGMADDVSPSEITDPKHFLNLVDSQFGREARLLGADGLQDMPTSLDSQHQPESPSADKLFSYGAMEGLAPGRTESGRLGCCPSVQSGRSRFLSPTADGPSAVSSSEIPSVLEHQPPTEDGVWGKTAEGMAPHRARPRMHRPSCPLTKYGRVDGPLGSETTSRLLGAADPANGPAPYRPQVRVHQPSCPLLQLVKGSGPLEKNMTPQERLPARKHRPSCLHSQPAKGARPLSKVPPVATLDRSQALPQIPSGIHSTCCTTAEGPKHQQ